MQQNKYTFEWRKAKTEGEWAIFNRSYKDPQTAIRKGRVYKIDQAKDGLELKIRLVELIPVGKGLEPKVIWSD